MRWMWTQISGRMPASSQASRALSTASLTVVSRALRGLSKPSRCRFLAKNSLTEMSRWLAAIDWAVARRRTRGGTAPLPPAALPLRIDCDGGLHFRGRTNGQSWDSSWKNDDGKPVGLRIIPILPAASHTVFLEFPAYCGPFSQPAYKDSPARLSPAEIGTKAVQKLYPSMIRKQPLTMRIQTVNRTKILAAFGAMILLWLPLIVSGSDQPGPGGRRSPQYARRPVLQLLRPAGRMRERGGRQCIPARGPRPRWSDTPTSRTSR